MWVWKHLAGTEGQVLTALAGAAYQPGAGYQDLSEAQAGNSGWEMQPQAELNAGARSFAGDRGDKGQINSSALDGSFPLQAPTVPVPGPSLGAVPALPGFRIPPLPPVPVLGALTETGRLQPRFWGDDAVHWRRKLS